MVNITLQSVSASAVRASVRPAGAVGVVGSALTYPHQFGASFVNVNGKQTMQESKIQAAIAAFLSGYAGDGASAVSAIVKGAKDAAAAKQSMGQALFSGFLALVEQGADGATVQRAGADVRRQVAQVMRVQAGFPAVKAKGSKEKGAPDFSTASVYANVVAECIAAQKDDSALWAAAFEATVKATDTPPEEHPCGLFATVNANKRAIADYRERVAAKLDHLFPAKVTDAPQGNADLTARIAELTRERDALKAYREANLQPGDAAEMYSIARAERDAATEALITAQAVVSRQAAELAELQAIAMEAARLIGAADGIALPELKAELASLVAAE
jgi:hypothetical protein